MATLVSVYDMPSDVATVVRKLKARGFEELTTYSPAQWIAVARLVTCSCSTLSNH